MGFRLKTRLLGAALGLMALAPAFAQTTFPDELVKRGKYLATASDCIACHTAHHGQPMAGGLVIDSPVGKIVATNITPSKQFGIGAYTEQQFADALRKGVRADGANLYPAMPYTAYANLHDEDVKALYAYFMQGVAAVDKPTEPTSLPFPMNIRASMKAWNALFLQSEPQKDAPEFSIDLNRGRYLVEGAAHCSTCHTPRGFLMQEQGGQKMAGALVGAWYAPNITPDKVSGIGSWSRDELVAYLKTGRLEGKAQAAGSMAEAITNSFSHMTDADLHAMAAYILQLPPVANAADAQGGKSRFEQGQAGNGLSGLRGDNYAAGMKSKSVGAQLFSANCASCHGYNAQGTRDGYYPSLFHNSATAGANATNLIATILYGVDRETAEGHVFMPPFGSQVNAVTKLSNGDVAHLANYILQEHGNGGLKKVSAADVQTVRAGGPRSPLITLARFGMGVGVLVLLVLGFWLLRRRSRQ
ncbi:c-type cytochrome [Xylophilus rhododendri]|uniref:C-type cytochrome n=1 Tax=Xylophilus rhododendri TaxID=2697032 RepID=A0A857JDR4_9BURK|nr:cytochrome c [Xylophilus rhododendri]QHJ01260.1 c-type cytochrome [Xylophilus rhododendri]